MTPRTSIIPVLALAFLVFVSACSDDPATPYTRGGIPFGTMAWKFKMEADVFGTVVSDNGTVYAADYHGILYAVDIATGTLRWKFETTGERGLFPVVKNGVVYYGNWDGMVYAIDAATGTVKWQSDLDAVLTIWPAVSDEAVFITTTSNCLYALNAATGAELWKKDTLWSPSPPAIEGNILTVTTRENIPGRADQFVYGFDATSGSKLWEYRIGYHMVHEPSMSGGNVFVGYDPQNVVCLDAETGQKKWEYETEDRPYGASRTTNGAVILSSLGPYLYALDDATGELKWKYNMEDTSLPIDYCCRTPIIQNGVIYTGTAFSSSIGTFFALDEQTGTPLWQYDVDGSIRNGATVSDGKVIFGNSGGHIYALNIQ